MIISGGGIGTSHNNRKSKIRMVWVRVRLRDVLLLSVRKEDADHTKEKAETKKQ